MGVIIQAANDKVILALISALLLTGAIGSNYTATEEKINVYDYKMEQIDTQMQGVIANPTDANIKAMYYDLMEEMQWSHRHVSERSAEYEAYLESCNDVLINLSKWGTKVNTEVQTEENVRINSNHGFWIPKIPSPKM